MNLVNTRILNIHEQTFDIHLFTLFAYKPILNILPLFLRSRIPVFPDSIRQ